MIHTFTALNLQHLFSKIVGNPKQFTLQHRLFNAFTFIGFVLVLGTLIFNSLSGLYYPALISLVAAVLLGAAYYQSTIKNRYLQTFVIIAVCLNLLLAINYFYNAGVAGPTLFLLLGVYLATMMISPKHQYIFWTILHNTLIILLLIIEFNFPDSIKSTYTSRSIYFLDNLITYLVVSLLVAAGVITFVFHYTVERKTVEKQSKLLGLLNDEKIRLISILSHDLRSPISGIQSYLDRLFYESLTTEEKEIIEQHLLDLTNRTQQLLNSVLHWSKDYYHVDQMQLSTVDLTKSLRHSSKLYTHLAQHKRIKLVLNSSSPLHIISNEAITQLIIRNLIDNAIKFTKEGGEIHLKTRKEGKTALISVADSGSGESQSVAEKISKSFENSADTYRINSGLGLMMCKQYTEALGGSIHCNTNALGGTTFVVRLPLS
ncbi:HAMP domain-containing histidine kinase [Olivibacter sp. SA151]|uniref:sensor histidine kinase n=1 Tax=Olivibacter jilunii TaxID=985016 RepID=UPI003F169DB0